MEESLSVFGRFFVAFSTILIAGCSVFYIRKILHLRKFRDFISEEDLIANLNKMETYSSFGILCVYFISLVLIFNISFYFITSLIVFIFSFLVHLIILEELKPLVKEEELKKNHSFFSGIFFFRV